jgi:hypothetical protein
MNKEPEQKKGNPGKRCYVKPETRSISLKDEEALSEFYKQKPFTPKDLKEMVNETLKAYGS